MCKWIFEITCIFDIVQQHKILLLQDGPKILQITTKYNSDNNNNKNSYISYNNSIKNEKIKKVMIIMIIVMV